jgi:biotin carboxyl carrier protein
LLYATETGGRVHHVTVSRSGSRLTVTVNGRSREVDAVRVGRQTVSLILHRQGGSDPAGKKVEGGQGQPIRSAWQAQVYDAVVAREGGNGRVVVRVGADALALLAGGGPGTGAVGGARPAGPQRIVAPMPGKVVRVLVRAGDHVGNRQPVVVVEAMKMENEMRSDRDGTVAEIHAHEGATVESGALLVVIQ